MLTALQQLSLRVCVVDCHENRNRHACTSAQHANTNKAHAHERAWKTRTHAQSSRTRAHSQALTHAAHTRTREHAHAHMHRCTCTTELSSALRRCGTQQQSRCAALRGWQGKVAHFAALRAQAMTSPPRTAALHSPHCNNKQKHRWQPRLLCLQHHAHIQRRT